MPRKRLTFGEWAFEDGAVLKLTFTNFFDGVLAFEWNKLPKFDNEADNYVEQFARQLAGIDYDKETPKVPIDNPATWNEISNCMGQYPFG